MRDHTACEIGPFTLCSTERGVVVMAEVELIARIKPQIERLLRPSKGQEPVYACVERHGAVYAGAVAEECGLSLANTSNHLKRMWERGLLTREEQLADSGGIFYLYRLRKPRP